MEPYIRPPWGQICLEHGASWYCLGTDGARLSVLVDIYQTTRPGRLAGRSAAEHKEVACAVSQQCKSMCVRTGS